MSYSESNSRAILALDVDGTICDRGRTPSRNVAEAIQLARSAAWTVVFCTGRRFSGLRRIGNDVLASSYSVTSDGAAVCRSNGEVVWQRGMPLEVWGPVVSVAQSLGLTCVVANEQASHAERMDSNIEYMLTYGDELPVIDHGLASRNLESTLLMIIDKDESDSWWQAKDSISEIGEVECRRSAPGYLSVVSRDVSKAKGLRHVTTSLFSDVGFVAAIGDGENDVPLFEFADVAIAMGGSPDALKALSIADVGSVGEDGAATAIRYFVENYPARLEGTRN